MSKFYADDHRTLQDRFETSGLADLMENAIVHAALTPAEQAFIEARDLFFLATVDTQGRPTVSYKGGAPGFVRAIEPAVLIFPCYDGNGMFYSMGNLVATPAVGMLFIDFERPHRLRVQGSATLSEDPALMALYPEAQLVVRVAIEQIWVNCGRYIHRYQRLASSQYVPDPSRETPMPNWKRIDVVQPALTPAQRARIEQQGGVITQEEYGALVHAGAP